MEPFHLIILTQFQQDVPPKYLNDLQANLFDPEFAFDGILLDQVTTLTWIFHLEGKSTWKGFPLGREIHAEENNKFHSLNIF